MSDSADLPNGHVPPPTTVLGILRRIGPGLIIAGSIVGSGELIATTKTGAEAGFWLLWLIIAGCVIKVFVQIELGRYTVSSGRSTMVAMDQLPGPRLGHRGNWVIWYWFIMFLASIGQLGGIVGGVGQALSISAPLTAQAVEFNRVAKIETKVTVDIAELRQHILRQGTEAAASEDGVRLTRILLEDLEAYGAELDDRFSRRVETLDDLERTDEVSAELKQLSEQRAALVDWRFFLNLNLEQLDQLASAATAATPDELEADELEADSAAPSQLAMLQQRLVELHDRAALDAEIRQVRSKMDAKKQPSTPEQIEILEDLTTRRLELAPTLDDRQKISWTGERELDEAFLLIRDTQPLKPPIDDKIWAAVVSVLTAIILVNGRFGLIQSLSTAMVACFTLITFVNLAALQQNPSWAVSTQDIINGMKFRLPPTDEGGAALRTALATFGIIGVGASELIAYPYWCLEKGYARFAGPREDSQAWLDRAKGWMRVMRVDAWGSMVVYTFATVAFYLLGAAVLGKSGLNPESHNLVRYLAVMYSPVFGKTTEILFLFGCFAVLYSTFFVANAGHARVFADAMRVMKLIPVTAASYSFWVKVLSGLFPMLCLVIYVFFPEPAELVLLSGIMQAVMLPMLAATALYLRYKQIDPRLAPSRLWDAFLWVSSLGMLIAGGWAGWSKIAAMLGY